VEYAKKLNKRIITILHQKVAAKDLPPALASVQWLDFSQHGGDLFITIANGYREPKNGKIAKKVLTYYSGAVNLSSLKLG